MIQFPPRLPGARPFDVIGLGGVALDRIVRTQHPPIPGRKLRVERWITQAGGRAATAVVTVARLGYRARFLGGVGDDMEGRECLSRLGREGIPTDGVAIRAGGFTQRAFILVDRRSGERTILWSRGDEVMLAPEEIDPSAVASGRILHTDAQAPRAAAAAARIAMEAGMPVLADIESVRDGLEELLPRVDFLLASEEFPESATGSPDLDAAMRILEDRTGGGGIVVTLGSGGAAAWTDGRMERFPAYAIDPVDTTGAGDVFHGAFAVACLRGLDLRDAIDFSNAVAAMKCLALGAQDGIPRCLEEVEAFRRRTPHRRPTAR